MRKKKVGRRRRHNQGQLKRKVTKGGDRHYPEEIRREKAEKGRPTLNSNLPLDFYHMCMYMYMCVGGQRSTLSIFISHCPPYVLTQGLSLNRGQVFWLGWLPTSSTDPLLSASATLGLLTRVPLYLVCIWDFADQTESSCLCGKHQVTNPSP